MFGLTNATFKYQTPKKKSVWRSTLETLTNLELENLRCLLTTEKNRRAILTETRATLTLHLFFARRTKAEPIRFSLVKQIFDFDFVNKSLDISATSSVSDGELKRQLQQDSSESFNNGRFKNKRRTHSDRLYDNTTESTDVRQQQRSGLLRRDQVRSRKKTRFLSTAEYWK